MSEVDGQMITADSFPQLLADIRAIIVEARRSVYAGINAIQIDHNWNIGRRIVEEEQGGKLRAEYGKRTIAKLSAHLCAEFGEGYSERYIWEFRRFYVTFPDIKILHTRVPNLSWSHFRSIMRLRDPVAREWYIQEASNECWNVRTLDRNISTQYYERLLLSQTNKAPVIAEMKKKTAAFQKDKLEFIKSPSVLEFIGLHGKQGLVEDDIEAGILSHLKEFMLELGKGFAFVESQKHMRTECNDYFIDLVFYNFMLKCFFLIDLKVGRITHQDVGQMDMYVRMYDEIVKQPDDNPTIGIVLCADTDPDIARYSILKGNEQIFATKYQLNIPTCRRGDGQAVPRGGQGVERRGERDAERPAVHPRRADLLARLLRRNPRARRPRTRRDAHLRHDLRLLRILRLAHPRPQSAVLPRRRRLMDLARDGLSSAASDRI